MQRGRGLRIGAVAVIATWTLASIPPAALAAGRGDTVRCESSSRETVRCAADTRGGVTLARQLSRAGCWYDETWGFDARGVWVSNGCRADFALGASAAPRPLGEAGTTPPASGQGISGTDVAVGAAAALVLGAIAVAVLANRDGGDDDDEDYDGDRDCRRDARGRCTGGADPWGRDRLVRCESQGYKERYCRVDTRRGVELYRQISKTRCRYQSNWGYDRRGIWVDRGCAAEFVIRG